MPAAPVSYFRRLVSSLVLSLAMQGLVFVATLQWHVPGLIGPMALVAAGLLPLVWYHLGILRPLVTRGAGNDAVDSVYYFGFLVTLGALAFGALGTSLARGGDVDVKQVVGQFALGLIATGYAIVARLHLSSLARQEVEASPEQTLDRYVTGSAVLLQNLETAAGALANLSRASVDETVRVIRDSHEALLLHLQTISNDFARQMELTFQISLRDGKELKGVVDAIADQVGSKALVSAAGEVRQSLEKLSHSVQAFAGEALQGARATNALALASGSFTERIHDAEGGLRRLGASDGPMHAAAEQIAQSSAKIAEGSKEIERAMLSLGEVAKSSGGVGATLKTLKSVVAKANTSLDALAQSVDRLAISASAMNDLAGAVERVSAGLEEHASVFPTLSDQASAATVSLKQLATQANDAGAAFAAVPTALQDAITPIDLVASAAQKAEKAAGDWSDQVAKGGFAIQQLVAAMEEARSLSTSLGALSGGLGKLAARLSDTERDLEQVSSGLNRSLKLAAQTLDQNVSRSGEAASLFAERLTVVAQKVIDGVNGGRGR